jgi:hypothetical protein
MRIRAKGWSAAQSTLTGHKSTYEQFVEASVLRRPAWWWAPTTCAGRISHPSPEPSMAIHTAVRSLHGFLDHHPRRKGLADFSNAGFFTAGKNILDSTNRYDFAETVTRRATSKSDSRR